LHLFFFHRILNLYTSGGIFNDFSFLHIMHNPNLVEVQHGFIAITNCDEAVFKDCTLSMLLKFEKHSPALRCMLIQYDDTHYIDNYFPSNLNHTFNGNTTFLSCIENSLNGGVNCIVTLLEGCFHHTNTKNDMTVSIMDIGESIPDFNVYPRNLVSHVILSNKTVLMDTTYPKIVWLGNNSYSGHWIVEPELYSITSSMLQNNIYEQHKYFMNNGKVSEGIVIHTNTFKKNRYFSPYSFSIV